MDAQIYDKTSTEIPSELIKYWNRRYELFSKFDEGIKLDRVCLFSAKPEVEASRIAKLISGSTVWDAFAGSGAVSIALALAGKKVIATELDSRRRDIIKHNAEVYGVLEKIDVLGLDAREHLSQLEADAVYLDPPWGGPDYYRKDLFAWSDFDPPMEPFLSSALQKFREVVISVPSNFDFNEFKAFKRSIGITTAHTTERVLFYNATYAPKL